MLNNEFAGVNIDQIFDSINKGAELGLNIANGISEFVDPESRRTPHQQNSPFYNSMQQQTAQPATYGYGYGDNGSVYASQYSGAAGYPGISDQSYGLDGSSFGFGGFR